MAVVYILPDHYLYLNYLDREKMITKETTIIPKNFCVAIRVSGSVE